jgi:tetratricopeptide (TPR) repeat protein
MDNMEKTRLEMLQEVLHSSPDNTFARYGLAMELKNAGREEEAWVQFQYLLDHHPDYAATYYQAGMLLVKLGRREEASLVLSKGIAIAGRQKNLHAQSELQAALEELSS